LRAARSRPTHMYRQAPPLAGGNLGVVVGAGAVEHDDRIAGAQPKDTCDVPCGRFTEIDRLVRTYRDGRMNARNLHGRIIAEASDIGPLPERAGAPVTLPLNIRMPDGVLDGARQVHSPNQDE